MTFGFQGQNLKNYISGSVGLINIERKESIGCWTVWPWNLTSPMTLDFLRSNLKSLVLRNISADWPGTKRTQYVTLNSNLNLGFLRSNVEIAMPQEWKGWLTWNRKDNWHGTKGLCVDNDIICTGNMLNWYLTCHQPPMDFISYSYMGTQTICHLGFWPWSFIFKAKFWNSCISGMGEPIGMEQKICELIGFWMHYVALNRD